MGGGVTTRAYLFQLEQHGIKLGLENIRRLLDAAGLSDATLQKSFPTVHLAGTNGKGSVAAMVDTMAQCAGYRVGRFTSPHLIDVRERFLINGQPISDNALDEEILFFKAIAETMLPPPTFFEMTTAIAMRWFARNAVDLGVIEVGMGGRLDSTNLIHPAASAITTIGLDHTQYLGTTLEEIAFEKAGILKPGTPLVLTENHEPACSVILEHARTVGSPVHLAGRDFEYAVGGTPFNQTFSYTSPTLQLGPMPLALAGRHQGLNAASAVTLATLLRSILPRITDAAISEGLRRVHWPCRMEKVLDNPPVIIDVAHNPAGAVVLAETMRGAYRQGVVLLAVSSDKDVAGIIVELAPWTSMFVLSPFTGTRAMSLPALTAALETTSPGHAYVVAANLEDALRQGLPLASTDCPLLITGSIFAAGEARNLLIRKYHASDLSF